MSEIEPFEFEIEGQKFRLSANEDKDYSCVEEIRDARWTYLSDHAFFTTHGIRALLAERTRLQSRIAELERAYNIESNNFCDTAVDYLALKEEDTRRAGVFARLMEVAASEAPRHMYDKLDALQAEWDAAPCETEGGEADESER